MAKGYRRFEDQDDDSNGRKLSQHIPHQRRRPICTSVETDSGESTSRRTAVSSTPGSVPARTSSLASKAVRNATMRWLDGSRPSVTSPDARPSRTVPQCVSDVSTSSESSIMVLLEPDDRLSVLNQRPAQRPTAASVARAKPPATVPMRRKVVHPAPGKPLGTRDQRPSPTTSLRSSTKKLMTHISRGSNKKSEPRSNSSYSTSESTAQIVAMPHPQRNQEMETQTSSPLEPYAAIDNSNISSPRSWRTVPDDEDEHNPLLPAQKPNQTFKSAPPRLPENDDNIDSAISERQRLVQDTVETVDSAVHNDRPEDVESLLNHAIEEVQKPAIVSPQQRRPSRATRLVIDESGSSSSSESSEIGRAHV